MNVKQLKALLADFSDDLEVSWGDPNFGGALSEQEYDPIDEGSFQYARGQLLIVPPAIAPLE